MKRSAFGPEKGDSFFSVHVQLMCNNGHQVIDESHRLKILRASHPLYSSDISPCDCWRFADFKERQKDRHLQGPEEILTAFQEL
jgi:hypothetical protein